MSVVSSQRFLVIYSGALTATFIVTVILGLGRGDFAVHRVSDTERQGSRREYFDQITVHRINIVEPDGTPRLIISDKAEFAGEFYHGKEIARPDLSIRESIIICGSD